MSDAPEHGLLDAVLDSWDRSNTILLNLLRAIPEGGLEARAMAGSPSIAELFAHIHYVRLVFVHEDAPDLARPLPEAEWVAERDRDRLARMLLDSASAVRDAVRSRVEAGRDMAMHYDHPILLLQHMLWHEGYHHGQMKLALKLAGRPLRDDDAGPLTWDVWMRKTRGAVATRVHQHVDAPRSAVYRLLLDPAAIATWRVPDGMTAHVHAFEAHEGGAMRVSLTYDAPTGSGKTESHTDTYHGRFVRLVPDELVVEAHEFETSDPALLGEMRSTIMLADAPGGGTDVVGVHEQLPPGVSPEDNETGWRMALAKLAALAEGGASTSVRGRNGAVAS
jgi:uncharacterized protein YndB with AHSA1/START domain/uncharacterized damage-inducible protein DinB